VLSEPRKGNVIKNSTETRIDQESIQAAAVACCGFSIFIALPNTVLRHEVPLSFNQTITYRAR
jgi:hypothetical protein